VRTVRQWRIHKVSGIFLLLHGSLKPFHHGKKQKSGWSVRA